MQTHVSQQTAIALREAGFPFPKGNEFWCPTATDILKELGGLHGLRFDDESEKWCCTKEPSTIIETTEPFMHENPAEAVAAAWLTYNRNK